MAVLSQPAPEIRHALMIPGSRRRPAGGNSRFLRFFFNKIKCSYFTLQEKKSEFLSNQNFTPTIKATKTILKQNKKCPLT